MAKPKLNMVRPSATAAGAAAADVPELAESRLTITLPERLHRNLKARAALEGVPIRSYVIRLLQQAGLDG